MYSLVLLLADNDYTFFNEDIDGVQKAVINKVSAQVYVKTENLDDFCERMLKHFGGYLEPYTYTGEIEYAKGIEILPNYTNKIDWDMIATHYPNYNDASEILESDLLTRYIDGELDDKTDIADIEKDCPLYLTNMEWAEHQSIKLDTELHNYALEKMNEKKVIFLLDKLIQLMYIWYRDDKQTTLKGKLNMKTLKDCMGEEYTAYNDKDIASMQDVINKATEMWRSECKADFEKNGDQGTCVMGAGIAIEYIAPRCRKSKSLNIISANSVASAQGSLNWERSVDKIVAYLRENGLECRYACGWSD